MDENEICALNQNRFSDQLRFVNDAAGFPPTVRRPVGPQAEEMERLSSALRKHGIDCAPLRKAYEAAFKRSTLTDASDCTHVTHRCNHAVHAYTGMPCAPSKSKKIDKKDKNRRS